jgi:hypothetical protein
MATTDRDGANFGKPFPSTTQFPLPQAKKSEERALPPEWGPAPLPSDSELYSRIAQEISEFKLGNKSSNPRLELLREKYRSIQALGCGDRWEGSAPYLGLTHLESADVFLRGSASRASQFSRWAGEAIDAPFPFTKSEARRLLHFLWIQPGWNDFNRIARTIAEIPNAYYFALIEALESGHATHENLGYAAPGVYKCYRRSTLMPHCFVSGLLAVVSYGNALRTIEVHRFRGGEGALPSVFEVYEGWMVKKSRQILIHAFDCLTRAFHLTVISNALSSPAEFSAATKPTKKNSKFQILSGIATGVVGQLGFYSVPTVYTRLGELEMAALPPAHAADSGKFIHAVLEAMENSPVCGQAYSGMDMIAAEELPELVRVQIEAVRRQYAQQNEHGATHQ